MLLKKKMASKVLLLPLSLVVLALSAGANADSLKVGFYEKTCPQAETIALEEMTKVMSVAPSLAGPLLRLHFHDCFVKVCHCKPPLLFYINLLSHKLKHNMLLCCVQGCDGSILLNATGRTPAEKDALPNLSLRGYSTIDRVKTKLEKACPGVVSCADTLAIVARDVVHLV